MENKKNISSTAILSALAGIMFFGPLIKSNLQKFNEEEQQFIKGYSKVGTLNIGLFVLLLIAFAINYFLPNEIITRIINIDCGVICGISIISIFACINDIQLFEANESEIKEIPHKEIVVKSFIPLYNISQRYQSPNFQTPYRRLIESIFWRIIFSFATMIFGNTVGIIIIAIIIIRIFLLLINIDIIPNSLKKVLNHSFLIYPEEITGYLIGHIKATFKKSDPNNEIMLAKQTYSDNKASGINSFLQYVSFLGILIAIHLNIEITYEMSIIVLALMIRGGRCLLTYWKYQKLPNIPFLYEIWSLIIK